MVRLHAHQQSRSHHLPHCVRRVDRGECAFDSAEASQSGRGGVGSGAASCVICPEAGADYRAYPIGWLGRIPR